MNLMDNQEFASSVVSGGLSGVAFSAFIFKMYVGSIMSHIDTLKKQNIECEKRNSELSGRLNTLQSDFIKHLADKEN